MKSRISYYTEKAKVLIRKHPVFDVILQISDLVAFVRGRSRGYFGQDGEDLFILEYFQGKTGKYVDVGANHPFKNSNTYLLYQNGWRGINIEPIPSRYEKLAKARPLDINLNFGVGQTNGNMQFYEMSSSVLSTFDKTVCDHLLKTGNIFLFRTYDVPILTLTNIYEQHLCGERIELLSIDTEGYEMEVLKGIDWEKLKPSLIIIESKVTRKNYNEEDIISFLSAKQYKIIKQIGFNSIWATEQPQS